MRGRGAMIVLGLGVALAGAACKPQPEFAGVGPWHLKKTQLRHATGRCEPTDLPDGRKGTWCFGQPALRVGGQDASIDLYFGGTDPEAMVIEIQLQFRGCRDELLERWVTKNFGEPYARVELGSSGHRWFLRNRGAFIIADLPSTPARCAIRMLPRSEEGEVERLRAEGAAARAKATTTTTTNDAAPAP